MRTPLRVIAASLLLLLICMTIAGCRPIQTEPAQRSVTGELYFPSVPEWGNVAVSIEMDVTELNQETHEATGFINWRNFLPEPAEGDTFWKVVNAVPSYVIFGADVTGADSDSVIVIAQIQSKEGWGQGEPGEYAYFWFKDTGAETPDQWGMTYYSADPWYEFYPKDAPPLDRPYLTVEEMQGGDSVLPLEAELGNIVIK